MDTQITVWFGAVLLLAVPTSSKTEVNVIPGYFEVGGTLTLRPTVIGTITNILWKYNGNLVAEWVKSEVELFYYDKYKNRTTLDTATGKLVMNETTKEDVGLYTVEINNKVHDQSFDVKWITRVPKPKVEFRPLTCGPESTSCNVICDLQEPESLRDAEPIQYNWKLGENDWNTMTKDITVTSIQTEEESIKTIACRMKNPVSQEDSKAEKNPMYVDPPPPPFPIWVIIVIVVLLLVAGVLFALWKFKPELLRRWLSQCSGESNVQPTAVGSVHGDPNTSSGAQPNNSSGAQPNNSSGEEHKDSELTPFNDAVPDPPVYANTSSELTPFTGPN